VAGSAATQQRAAPAGSIGTHHPLLVEATAADGRWVVLCQAREDTDGDGRVAVRVGPRGELLGDRLSSYLVVGTGPGEAVDELLGSDPTGRWLVLRQRQRVLLRDTRTQRSVDLTALGADTRADRLRYRPHRTLSFDRLGSRLLYVRRRGQATEVVVRQLESGTETLVDPGPGVLWRAELDAQGQWAIVHMLVDDTNGNGRLDWPVPPAEQNRWRCTGPIPQLFAWQGRGDTPVIRVAPSSGGATQLVTGFVAPFGSGLLEREPGGRLMLRDASQRSRQLASAKCDARVVHADPTRGLVVAACSGATGRPPLVLLGPGYHQDLSLEVAPHNHHRWPQDTPRLLPLYPGQDTALLDLDRRVVHRLRPGDGVIATSGPRALLRRSRSLLIFDGLTGREHRLPGRTAVLPDVLHTDPIAVVSPLVVDVRAGRLLGKVTRRPLAASRSGQVLVAEGGDPNAQQLALGPLRWVDPRQPASTSKAGAGDAGTRDVPVSRTPSP
jgi:hypothetical protein